MLGPKTNISRQYFRDAAWLGIVGSRTFTMNFDTSVCKADVTECQIVASNSFADSTLFPDVVRDPGTAAGAMNLCNTHVQTGWITNVWGVNATHGVGYFLNITHDYKNGAEYTEGTSPIILDTSSSIPVCTRIDDAGDFWQNTTSKATYGNGGTISPADGDGFLHVYGTQNHGLFLARVPFDVGSVSKLSAYTYWNGESFVSDESAAVSILSTLGGSIFHSNYLNKYIWLTQPAGYGGVYAYLADQPQGPFSTGTLLFQDAEHGGTYAPSAQTQYDTTGKTVAIVYSVVSTLSQRVVTVTWA